jgi:hypothetical protein
MRSLLERGRSSQRLDEDVTSNAAAERDLHPVDLHEERPAKRAASGQADDVTRVDAEVVQSLSQTLSRSDVEHACLAPGAELIERHGLK